MVTLGFTTCRRGPELTLQLLNAELELSEARPQVVLSSHARIPPQGIDALGQALYHEGAVHLVSRYLLQQRFREPPRQASDQALESYDERANSWPRRVDDGTPIYSSLHAQQPSTLQQSTIGQTLL
jgi:hypothetical protein